MKTDTSLLQDDPQLHELVTQKQSILDREIGGPMPTATARWQIGKDDRGRELLLLELKDHIGSYTAAFARDELGNDYQMGRRLHELSDRLIHSRNSGRDIDLWKQAINAFYETITGWATALQRRPEVNRRRILVNEQASGIYAIDELILTRANREMRFRPVARWVAGADGQVNLITIDGPFVLVYRNSQWFWMDERVGVEDREFDEQLFQQFVEASLP